MNLRSVVTVCLLFFPFASRSQNIVDKKIKFGDVTAADFAPKFYPIDSTAEAVVLYDGGSAKYEGNSDSWFNIVYTYHQRIRILNKNAFSLATIDIPLYMGNEKQDDLDKLEAVTYTLENGQVVKTKIDKASVFKDKASSDMTIRKFTFPNLKEGCIIEYTYTINSPRSFFLRGWQFQEKYPVLQSEYETAIPTIFNYVFLNTGYYDLQPVVSETSENFRIFFKDNSATGSSSIANYNGTVIHSKWSLTNLPAMVKEKYTSTLENYIARIEFQLRSINMPDAAPRPVMQTWDQLVTELLKNGNFGSGLSEKNNWMGDNLAPLIVKGDDLQTAKNIYTYVQHSFSSTGNTGISMEDDLKSVYRAKKGNTAAINLVVTAMLRKARITADPVLLSTRNNGFAYEQYPLIDKFNYVITRAVINSREYLLDASVKKMGFDHLPDYCYNGYGRIINTDSKLVSLFADSLKESKTTSIYISNSDDGKKLTGTFSSDLGYYESYDLRDEISASGQADFFKKLKTGFTYDMNIQNEGIDSLDKYTEKVNVHYDFSFAFDEDIVYYNPLLTEAYKSNPFSAATRNYPVEMPNASDETIIVNMEIPKGYKIDELPKSVRLKLNESDGMFEYLIQADSREIQLRCRLRMNKATFSPEDYDTLREFFSQVVKKQAEKIVFKKTK